MLFHRSHLNHHLREKKRELLKTIVHRRPGFRYIPAIPDRLVVFIQKFSLDQPSDLIQSMLVAFTHRIPDSEPNQPTVKWSMVMDCSHLNRRTREKMRELSKTIVHRRPDSRSIPAVRDRLVVFIQKFSLVQPRHRPPGFQPNHLTREMATALTHRPAESR
jgi:hypothetical protein